ISVYSNDPVDSVLQLKVSATVVTAGDEAKPVPPVVRTHPHEPKLVLAGDCLKCHAPKGAAETGLKLFGSTCAACHGAGGDGVRIGTEIVGPALKLATMTVKTAAGIRQIISAGTGHP